MTRVIETGLDEDLKLFSAYLRQTRVDHRVFADGNRQVLAITDPRDAERVRHDYQAWRSGELRLREVQPGVRGPPAWRRAVAAYPGISGLIGLCILFFPVGTYHDASGFLQTIFETMLIASPTEGLSVWYRGEVWRWFSPMFLHFGWLHLAFNSAVAVELGRRIEAHSGGVVLWVIVLTVGAVSNLGQYAWSQHVYFGGLSGAVYGLLGVLIVLGRRAPDVSEWRLPPGFAIGLVVFLVIFSTGFTESFGLAVANTAHWVGLLSGALIGLVWPLGARDRPVGD